MDSLPQGMVPALLILLLVWSALLSAVEAAHQHLRIKAAGNRGSNDVKLLLNPNSLVVANVLAKTLLMILCTFAAMGQWFFHGALIAWLGTASVLLVFGEFIPRKLAARFPEAVVLLGNNVLRWPLLAIRPLTWLYKNLAKVVLRPLLPRRDHTVETEDDDDEPPAPRTGVVEHIPGRSRALSGIQALDRMTVNDILVPRSEVDGVNLDASLEQIVERLIISRHTRLPVFHNDINQVQGILDTRVISHLLPQAKLTKQALLEVCYEPYFVPESTPLQLQLMNFHKQKRRLGIVVDEYGEVLGIVSLEDILEEIVGEFESEQNASNPHIQPQEDGRLLIDGATPIRELNKVLGWHLPSDGPKTLNGLITEALEAIPENAVCLKIGPYRIETVESEDNRVTQALMWESTRMPVVL